MGLVVVICVVEYEIKRVKAWVESLVGSMQSTPKAIMKAEAFVLTRIVDAASA
jgi:hypothetical protein